MRTSTLTIIFLLLISTVLGQNNTEAPTDAPTEEPTEAEVLEINSGDTAWVLTSIALVMLMTPGIAFFYGGLVGRQNAINTLMLCLITMGIITIEWVLFGYSLAFADGTPGIGDLRWGGLKGVNGDPNPAYGATIPHICFAMFQMMFAIITPALICGSVVGRIKFQTWLIFIAIWHIVVYDVIAHMVWSTNGWLRGRGAIDFAGGTVVHISSGVSALAAAIVVGKRTGTGETKNPVILPWNVPFNILGAALLWFGWFGFNAGSALAANKQAGIAAANTTIAAASGFFFWSLIDRIIKKKFSAVGGAMGAVVGLVAITPAAGYIVPGFSILFGLFPVIVSYIAIELKEKFKFDDTLDAFNCHGLGGIVGAFMTGLFAAPEIGGAVGAFYGNPGILGEQMLAIVITIIMAGGETSIILLILKYIPFIGLRVSTEQELSGIDQEVHGDVVYGTKKPVDADTELDTVDLRS
eukprot:TRINITY_DN1814_c0_g3_i3.p1 TRINITY_DN1814_c0_g3~~TRINITY_DN1814_c0_g3_i3.p1  ORF type:complete len:467 (-),score=78.92 TRINITY_DN1814_c0_g3_i3:24-1424(-)